MLPLIMPIAATRYKYFTLIFYRALHYARRRLRRARVRSVHGSVTPRYILS